MIVSFQQQNQTLCFQELLATEIVNLDTPLKLSMDVLGEKKRWDCQRLVVVIRLLERPTVDN